MQGFNRICNDIFTPYHPSTPNVYEKLPAGTYLLKFDPEIGWLFKQIPDMDLPSKIYGDTDATAEKIISTYKSRDKTTGVMLSGDKGSGKTLLTKVISSKLRAAGIPTILVNVPFGEKFSLLVQDIEQEVMFLLDEFEKNFDNGAGEQDSILTLLDGTFTSKKMFLFTSNNSGSLINANLQDRPGRIFYWLRFNGLTMDMVRGFAEDRLDDKTQVDNICRVARAISSLTFDMMQALIEEMNRYKQTPLDAMKMLNIPDCAAEYGTYVATVTKNGADMPVTETHYAYNPYSTRALNLILVKQTKLVPEKEQAPSKNASNTLTSLGFIPKHTQESRIVRVSVDNLVREDVDQGIYDYEVGEYQVRLTLRTPTSLEWKGF